MNSKIYSHYAPGHLCSGIRRALLILIPVACLCTVRSRIIEQKYNRRHKLNSKSFGSHTENNQDVTDEYTTSPQYTQGLSAICNTHTCACTLSHTHAIEREREGERGKRMVTVKIDVSNTYYLSK